MSTGRSAISEQHENVASTAAVLLVWNSWVTPGQNPTSGSSDQPDANVTVLLASGYVRGPKNYQISATRMHKQQTNQNNQEHQFPLPMHGKVLIK
jgi:hypothetical protein